MAGAAFNADVTKISAGRKVDLWYNVSIPAAGAVISLDPTTGAPDLTTNPNAKHLGLTDKGATLTAKASYQDFNADELSSPVKTVFSGQEMSIAAALMQVEDMDIMQLLTSGFGTLTSPSGGKRLSFGIGAQAYSSIAAIWRLEADTTKFCIFHIFKAINKNGIDGFNKSRVEKSTVNAMFMGYDIPGRAETETVGYYYIPNVT